MKKDNKSRKGFTLVELLIVIVVIGILSAMMMLSSTEAMSSARAAKIISDLRNLKTAVIAWYVDHPDLVDTATGKVREKITNNNNDWKAIQNLVNNGNDKLGMKKYLNNENWSFNEGNSGENPIKEGGYGICDGGSTAGTKDEANRTSWFVGYRFAANEDSVKEKLYGRAKSLGLVFSNNTPNNYQSGKVNNAKGDKVVWMRVFGDYQVTTIYE
ncbi:MAG: type II secretion system protein [Synergistaceae bacterium]|nr:type II secretion system protein [Synergistaceae bacterium]